MKQTNPPSPKTSVRTAVAALVVLVGIASGCARQSDDANHSIDSESTDTTIVIAASDDSIDEPAAAPTMPETIVPTTELGDGVTLEQYRRLSIGMDEADAGAVVSLGSCELQARSEYPGFVGRQYQCSGAAEYSFLIIGIQNGKVSALNEIGLR